MQVSNSPFPTKNQGGFFSEPKRIFKRMPLMTDVINYLSKSSTLRCSFPNAGQRIGRAAETMALWAGCLSMLCVRIGSRVGSTPRMCAFGFHWSCETFIRSGDTTSDSRQSGWLPALADEAATTMPRASGTIAAALGAIDVELKLNPQLEPQHTLI